MDGVNTQNTGAVTSTVNPAERSQALASARRRATESALADAKAAEARRADTRRNVQAILERALGANTRLSVERNEMNQNFIYRAIDEATGEVVREWPPAQFAQFLAEYGGEIGPYALAGALVDQQI